MENKKVFIGNLDFSATEAELKSLLSKFGSVASVQMKQKKGNAIIEMENADAAAQAVQQLEGTKHKDREIRASLFMKARRARSVSVRNYKERGANLARKSAKMPNASQRPHVAEKPSHSGRPARDGYKSASPRSPKPGSGFKPRERSAGSERGSFKSSSRERSGSARPLKRPWSADKPSSRSVKTGDNRGERPERKKTFSSKTRDNSKPRSSSGSQNRASKPSRLGAGGGRSVSGSAKPKPRGNYTDRGKPPRRD